MITASGHHRSSRVQPGFAGSRGADDAGDIGAFEGLGEPLRRDPEGLNNLSRPVAFGKVEQQSARAACLVDGELSGQPVADVVLRQQDVRHPVVELRLVVSHPEKLWCREAGQRVVPCHLDEAAPADPVPDLVALCLGPLVVPQDRGAQHIARGVEKDEPVHLPR